MCEDAEAIMYRNRANRVEHLKPIGTDKEMIKEYLRSKIGTTYATATAPSDANLLLLDLADWGGNSRTRRDHTPWAQMRRAMQDYRPYVQKNVTQLCRWHRWL